ncbi:hypothetical protein AMJ80_01330 [bacterium SM23_31]|nr:MAG: hypothetical protein AMJ80_01330 [bacterium SM23_31]
MLQSEKYDIDRIFRLIVSLITLCLLFLLVYYLRMVLIPFAIAFIIANLLDPVVDLFERIGIPRVISIILVFLIIFGILFLIFFFGIPYIISELSQFSQIFPNYISNIYQLIASKLGEDSTQSVDQYLNKIIENLQSTQFVDTLINYLTNIFSQLLNLIYLLVGSVIVVMYVFFLLRDIHRFRARWLKYIPEKYRDTVQMFVRDTYYYTVTFFRGQLTIVTILGILFAIGFSIVDIRLAILIGFLAGFLNLIPNFGTLVAIIPAVLLAIGRAVEVDGSLLLRIGGVLIVFLVVQLIQDMILIPTIMGKRTGLRPATILFSVFVWGKLLGFLGVILAIPLTCLTKVYFARFVLKEKPVSLEMEKKE